MKRRATSMRSAHIVLGDVDRGAPLAPPPTHTAPPAPVAVPAIAEGPRDLVIPAGGLHVPCAKCGGSSRVFYWPKGQSGVRTVEATPCPACRPEASVLGPDGRVKDAEGRRAAFAARQRGL